MSKKKRRLSIAPFKSQFEKDFYESLPDNKKPIYESDKLEYTLLKKYNPDWKFFKKSGGFFYVETKGLFVGLDRTKLLAVKKQHPDKEIRLVFMVDNYLYKGAKQRYSDWAIEHGFDYHVVGNKSKFIPDSWLEEVDCFTVNDEILELKEESNDRRRKKR